MALQSERQAFSAQRSANKRSKNNMGDYEEEEPPSNFYSEPYGSEGGN